MVGLFPNKMSDDWEEMLQRFGPVSGEPDSDIDISKSDDEAAGVDLVGLAQQVHQDRQARPKGRPKKIATTSSSGHSLVAPPPQSSSNNADVPLSQSLAQPFHLDNLVDTKKALEPILPQMTEHVSQLADLILVESPRLDQPTLEAMQQRLVERQVVSKTVAACHAGLSHRKYEHMRLHLSTCILWSERLYRASLEHFLLSCVTSNVVMYCDGPHMHDEFAIRLGFDLPVPDPVGPVSSAQANHGRTAGVCKVLQTQSHYGLLVQVGSRFLLIQGSQGTWLQVLDSTSGEVILKALKQSRFLTTQVEACPLKVRLACTDSHKATRKAEEMLVDDQAGWLGLHLFCEAHYAAICLRHTLSLVSATTSGMVHLRLALRGSSGNIATFRKCLAAIIHQKLRILHGKPSASADRFREACLSLFSKDRPHWASRMCVLRCLANGDWSNGRSVEHYTSSVDEPSRDEIITAMTQKLVWALIPSVPVVFKPKSWGDTDHAMCDLWLLHACHGLLDHAFSLYCRVMGSSATTLEQALPPASTSEGGAELEQER